jgi:hypothetical protein
VLGHLTADRTGPPRRRSSPEPPILKQGIGASAAPAPRHVDRPTPVIHPGMSRFVPAMLRRGGPMICVVSHASLIRLAYLFHFDPPIPGDPPCVRADTFNQRSTGCLAESLRPPSLGCCIPRFWATSRYPRARSREAPPRWSRTCLRPASRRRSSSHRPLGAPRPRNPVRLESASIRISGIGT